MALKERGTVMYATYSRGKAPTWIGRAFGAKEAPGTYSDSYVRIGRHTYKYSAVGFPAESDDKTVVRFHARSENYGELYLQFDEKCLYAYRGKIHEFTSETPTDQEAATRIRYHVMKTSSQVSRMKQELQGRSDATTDRQRTAIPREVQAFVWNRDGSQCVHCGSKSNLEFDHIVPVARGGSNTSRNIQLLCEACNRNKGPGF